MNARFFQPISWFILLGMSYIGLSPCVYANEPETLETSAVTAEVMVFVDVSGSMKKNDPENMRAPAIRMLSGMAPENARVGIYLFGTTVRELVPFQQVDEGWKQRAEKSSQKYQSRDMYTNIEAALKAAENTWSNDTTIKRSIILLTDGIVDIDKNPDVSANSRKQILGPVLESLKQQNTNIHTIALSQNADHELLKALAISTDGKNHQVDNAELLQRTFMNLFEQSAPQDTVPIDENSFTVDKSISEITLLIFRSIDAKTTEVQSPKGPIYTASTVTEGLKWKHDTGYDLISIKNPAPGQWQIFADTDPDNRAMVVTDLKLKTDEVPITMLNGEEIEFKMWLEEEGKIIDRPDFLKLIKTSVITKLAEGEEIIKTLDQPNKAGYINYLFGPEWETGEYEFVVKIDGETFVREKRFPITAYASPMNVNWEKIPIEQFEQQAQKAMPKNILDPEQNDDPQFGWIIHVDVVPDLINLKQSILSAEFTTQTGNKKSTKIEETETGWLLKYVPDEAGQNTVLITLNTKSLSGRDIVINEPEIKLGEIIEITQNVSEPINSETSNPTFIKVIIPVAAGNILFLIIFLGWKIFKRMRESSYLHPEEAL